MKNRRITKLGVTAFAVLATCVVSITQAAEIAAENSRPSRNDSDRQQHSRQSNGRDW